MRRWSLMGIGLVALAGGCQAPIEAYYNANEKIVARRLFYNNERVIAVDADGPLSRPSVARHDGTVWIAWRHDYQRPSGEFVRGIGVGGAPCSFDDAVLFDERGSGPLSTPGLAAHGDRLALAWCRDDTLVLRTSTDGVAWTEAATMTSGPLSHVALAVHGGRLFAAGVRRGPGTGGTVTVFPVGDDHSWTGSVQVATDPRLDATRGVSLASDGTALLVGYAVDGAGVAFSRSPSGEQDWAAEGGYLAEPRIQPAVLVPALAWDGSKGRLRAAWTDGAQLWVSQREGSAPWERPVRADTFTPSLSNPAGAALVVH